MINNMSIFSIWKIVIFEWDQFLNLLLRNVVKWSDPPFKKSCSICCNIYKVCLTILWHCKVKGKFTNKPRKTQKRNGNKSIITVEIIETITLKRRESVQKRNIFDLFHNWKLYEIQLIEMFENVFVWVTFE